MLCARQIPVCLVPFMILMMVVLTMLTSTITQAGATAQMRPATTNTKVTNKHPPKVKVSITTDQATGMVIQSEDTMVKSFIGLVETRDPDKGPAGDVRCESSNPVVAFMEIGPGYRKMELDKELDRERTPIENVTIICKDKGEPPRTGSVSFTIKVTDVNDNAPKFTNNPDATVKLAENVQIGHFVTRVSAVDLDEGDNARVKYSLEDEELIRQLIDGGIMIHDDNFQGDMEMDDDFELGYMDDQFDRPGSDFEGSQFGGDQDVYRHFHHDSDLNEGYSIDHERQYLKNGQIQSKRKQKVRVVGKGEYLNSYYENYEFQHESEIMEEDGDRQTTRTPLPFRIDPETGDIYTTDVIDRETNSEITLFIAARDHGAVVKMGITTLRIIITDMNDNPPMLVTKEFHVRENMPPRTVVGHLKAVDLDEGPNAEVIFSKADVSDLDSNEDSDEDQEFDILSESYSPFIIKKKGKILTTVRLDREIRDSYHLVVVAKDKGSPRLTTTSTVSVIIDDVNDNTPVILSRCLGAHDSGENSIDGLSMDNEYGIDSSEEDFDSNDERTKNKNKRSSPEGDALPKDSTETSYESGSTIDAVTTYANKVGNSTASIIYQSGDDGDTTTVHNANKKKSLRRKNGELVIDWATPDNDRQVYAVDASDADSGLNSVIYYSIDTVQGSDTPTNNAINNRDLNDYGSIFKINSTSGKVSLRRHVIASDPLNHLLNISVRDGGNPSRSAYCLLNVTFDVDVTLLTPPPVTTETPYEGGVSGSSASGNSTNGTTTLGPMCVFHSSSLLCTIAFIQYFANLLLNAEV